MVYEQEVALCLALDAEWTRRGTVDSNKTSGLEAFSEVFDHLRAECDKYFGRVKQYLDDLEIASGIEAIDSNRFRTHLFKPACFIQFGRSDCLAWVIVDDFDPIHHLSAQSRTTVEQVSLAFLPNLQSLGIAAALFVPLRQLLLGESKSGVRGEMPGLLTFTKLKLDGLACVGGAARFQEAAFKVVARKIEAVISDLLNYVKKNPERYPLFAERDISECLVSLLDLQGTEEIGILIRANNYSIAASIIAAVQHVTYDDLFVVDAELKQSLIHSDAYTESLLRYCKLTTQPISEDPSDIIGDNHVFRWSNSVLAVAEDVYLDEKLEQLSGYVSAQAELRIACGHQVRLYKRWEDAWKESDSISSKDLPKHHRCLIGNNDLFAAIGTPLAADASPFIHARDFIVAHRKIVRDLVGDHKGRDVVGLDTRISLPLPEIQCLIKSSGEFGDRHCALLCRVLGALKESFYEASEGKPSKRELVAINYATLVNSHRAYGLPVALRRSIENLYQIFVTFITNPLLFDCLLDLYDSFLSFYRLLTKELPHRLKLDSLNNRFSTIDERGIQQVAAYADAIKEALEQRMESAHAGARPNDMGVLFRGGLAQVIFAGDAVLKCGVGFLRKVVLNSRNDLSAVGVISQSSLMPGIRSHLLRLGVEKRVRLGFLEVDVAHLFTPASFTEYFHEAFHLVFDEAFRNGEIKFKGSSASEASSVRHERLSEIYVHILHHVFLAGQDSKQYIPFQLCRFSDSVRCSTKDFHETVMETTEVMIRLFCVSDAFSASRINQSIEPEQSFGEWWDDESEVLNRFKLFFEEHLVYVKEFGEAPHNVNSPAVRRFAFESFAEIFRQLKPDLPIIWKHATAAFLKFLRTEVSLEESLDDLRAKADCVARDSLKTFTPVVTHPLQVKGDKNPMFLLCSLLRVYMEELALDNSRAMHLPRDPETGSIRFKKGHLYNYLLLDRGAAGRFCSHPEIRARRLGMQVCILKTCWGLSSVMRGRRLALLERAQFFDQN